MINKNTSEQNQVLKSEPEKLVISNNKRQTDLNERSGMNKITDYKKLNSEDNDIKQGGTDIYSEKMKVRIPDPTFDDNYLGEKSNNSLRIKDEYSNKREEDINDNGINNESETKRNAEDEIRERSKRTEENLLNEEDNNDNILYNEKKETEPKEENNEDGETPAANNEGENAENNENAGDDAEEKPAEENAEEKPAEEENDEEKPAEDEENAEEKPAEDEENAEEKPAEDAPAEENAEEKPAEDAPAEEAPAEEKPAEE